MSCTNAYAVSRAEPLARCLVICLATLLSAQPMARAEDHAALPADLLFKVNFDEAFSAHAVYARGKKDCSLTADLGLRGQRGIVKNALLLEPGETCSYDAKESINPSQGTLSFWIRPVTWEARTLGPTTLFRLTLKGSPFSLRVSKAHSMQKIDASLVPDDPGLPPVLCSTSVGFQKDQWTKLDIAWDSSHLAVYADGQLAREVTFSRFTFPSEWTAGTLAFTPGQDRLRTAVDEIEIFSTRHFPARILQRYREIAGPDAGQDMPPISLTCIPRLDEHKVGIALRFNDAEALERWQRRATTARVGFTVAGPDGAKAEQGFPLGRSDDTYWVPLNFVEGTYTIRGTLSDRESGDTLPFTGSLTKPAMPWLGAKTGVSDAVLDPWTPLECPDDRTVNCWGRSYRFCGPFPSAIENQGKPMLRGPICLEIETAGGSGPFEEVERRAVSRKPNRAEFAGTGRFAGIEGSVRWESWIEYDGVTYATFTLLPPTGGWEVRSLRLRVPLRQEVMCYERGRQHAPCYSKIAGTTYTIANFANFLWFSNEDRGLLYFCDNEANWVYDPGAELIAVDAKQDPGFELRLIHKPVRLDKPITYEIGFEATPVKPLLPGWRAHRFGGTPENCPGVTDQVYSEGNAVRHGLWGPKDPQKLREIVEKRAAQGCQSYLYSALGTTPDSNPVYDFFAPVWNSPSGSTFGPYQEGGRATGRAKPEKPQYYMRPVEPGHAAYVDYITWLAEQTERDGGPVCLYTDIFGLQRPADDQLNPHSPFTIVDAFGRRVYRYQFLGVRDYAKRVATIVRKYSRPDHRVYWMGHQHSRLVPPFHGFVDWFFPGEEYTAAVARSDNPYYYMDDLPEEQWRTGFGSSMSGIPHVVLPELGRSGVRPKDELAKDPGPTQSLVAMCAVSDVVLRAADHQPSMAEWWKLRDRAGITRGDMQFIPYWRDDCPARTETPRALASVYRSSDRAVIALANREPKATVVAVRLDLAALGLPGKELEVTDERSGKALQIQNGRVTAEVQGRNYTYIRVRP